MVCFTYIIANTLHTGDNKDDDDDDDGAHPSSCPMPAHREKMVMIDMVAYEICHWHFLLTNCYTQIQILFSC